MTPTKRSFGLSYTHDKKWLAIPGNRGVAEDFDEWEPKTTYQVVLQVDSDYWTVIVDQEKIDHESYDESLFDSHRISHFYIGGDSNDQSATGGHVTVTNVVLYNEKLLEGDLDELHASKVTIPSLGVEKHPAEQAANTGASVASESKTEETTANHAKLTEDDNDEQREENSVHGPVLAVPPSTVAAGSFVSELAVAAESAGASCPEDGARLPEGGTAQQTTLSEDNESMQRDSEEQPQELQSAELTELNEVEKSSESSDTEPPEEGGEANGRSGGSVSSVAVSSDMETVAPPADGEHQVQQSTEPSAENEDVRSTGTGTTGAERSLSLEARY
ncbi:trans-sialidase [Trypanosoma cruzi]|nr:trans-sialidase [Trypanosoma cruzi]